MELWQLVQQSAMILWRTFSTWRWWLVFMWILTPVLHFRSVKRMRSGSRERIWPQQYLTTHTCQHPTLSPHVPRHPPQHVGPGQSHVSAPMTVCAGLELWSRSGMWQTTRRQSWASSTLNKTRKWVGSLISFWSFIPNLRSKWWKYLMWQRQIHLC